LGLGSVNVFGHVFDLLVVVMAKGAANAAASVFATVVASFEAVSAFATAATVARAIEVVGQPLTFVVAAKFSVVAVVGAIASDPSFFYQYSSSLRLFSQMHPCRDLVCFPASRKILTLLVFLRIYRFSRLCLFSGTGFGFWRQAMLVHLR